MHFDWTSYLANKEDGYLFPVNRLENLPVDWRNPSGIVCDGMAKDVESSPKFEMK